MRDTIVGVENKYEELGLKELTVDRYLEIMKDESYEEYAHRVESQWFICEGDLKLSSEELSSLDNLNNLLITGDLIVDGVLNVDLDSLFILGDVKAKNILVGSLYFYVGGIAYFDEALILAMGDGQPIVINDTKGPFVFTQLDSAEVNVSKEKVKVFLDYSYCLSFGDIKDFLIDSMTEVNDDGKLVLNEDVIYRAILNNETILS